MPDFILNKLVRDNLPTMMKAANQIPVYRVLEGHELQKALLTKIKEEANEAIDAIDDDEAFTSELADMQDIIDSLLMKRNIERATLITMQQSISNKKGSFNEGYFLEKVSVDEASEWTQYYRNEPDRFGESGVESKTVDDVPKLEIGEYEHYKGGHYEVLGLARHSEDQAWFVVYKPLYEHIGQPDTWIRPYEMFAETVTIGGKAVPRFNRLDTTEKQS